MLITFFIICLLCLFAIALVTVRFIRVTKILLIVPQKKLESIYEQFEDRRALKSVRQWVINAWIRLSSVLVHCSALLEQSSSLCFTDNP